MTRSIKAHDALFAIQLDTAYHATLGDANNFDDPCLFAGVRNGGL